MLAPQNAFLLGIINIKPINPYEILGVFEFNRMKTPLKYADSTIYYSIRMLNKNGFIDCEMQQNGSMPTKRVYSITEKGRAELKKSLKAYLSGFSDDWSAFSISLHFMSLFEKSELIGFLEKRKQSLEKEVQHRIQDFEDISILNETRPCVPGMSSAFHLKMHFETELEVTVRVLNWLRETEIWPQDIYQIFAPELDTYIKRADQKV